jgi:anti-sigma factor RsiW
MKEDIHQKAESLIAAAGVEGLSPAQRAWLESHLAECAPCAGRAASLERVVASLRAVPISLDPAVVEATRRRLRLRARELREQQSRMRGLWMACALSWMLGALSAPLLWWGLEWLGERVALPQPVWVMAFLMWWVVPAALIGAVLAWRRTRAATENGHAATLLR